MFRSSKSLHRLGIAYCLVVVLLAIFLVFHAAVAVETESNSLRFLNAADLRLPATHILLHAELSVWELAESLLNDPSLVALGEQGLGAVQEGRSPAAFEESVATFKQHHPIISEFFISGGGRFICACDATESALHRQISWLLSAGPPVKPGNPLSEIHSVPLAGSTEHLFYRTLANRQPPLILGVVVSLDQMVATLIPGAVVGPIDFESAKQPGPLGSLPAGTGSEAVQFNWIFPGRTVLIPESLIFERRDTLYSSMRRRIISGTLSVLLACFGLFTIYRLLRTIRETEIKSTFLSGISHDIRTPISLVRLYTDTLLENPDLTEGEKAHSIEVIGSEVQRLEQMVDRLLTFSRISRRKFVLTSSPGDLRSTIQRVLNSYSAFLRKSGFRLRVDLPERLPLVRHDPTALAEALLNLLENSRKYSAVIKEIKVSVFENGGGVAIEVADRGVGISKRDEGKVFDAWFRGSHRDGSGEGLGLSIVKHIVEQHEGKIDLESKVGVGTTVRITLPAVKP
ncbi:MAG: HAMP domain-containing histidine kinase [Acidobacteriota bacterium]|nr:MAG: HAMP domain-containing histidine kinase [Acidobacteriota bacterium]